MKINCKYFLLPLLAVALNSCKITMNYEQPPGIATAEPYRSGLFPEDSTSIAYIPWDEMFTDVLLQGYIQQVLDSNYDLRIAMQRMEEAQAFLRQAEAGNTPLVNAQANYGGQHPSSYSVLGSLDKSFINQYDLGAYLSWEADIWGKISSLKEAAKAQYLQSATARQLIQTELVASVASMYYQLLAMDEQAAIAKATIETRRESLATTQALKEAGMLTAAAVKQTEAQIYEAQITLLNIEKAIVQIENALSILLTESPHAIQRSTLTDQRITTELRTGVSSLLLENRPDVKLAEYELMNAFYQEEVAKTDFYPTLTISLGAGLSALEKSILSPNAIFGSVGAGLLAPVLSKKRIKTRYEVAQAEQEIALLNFRKAFLAAVREVSDALQDYHTATETIDIQKKQVEALLLATDYAKQLLSNGKANYLEVLTAQQQTLFAQLQLVNTNYQQLNAVVMLYRALGGGWR